MEACRSSVPPSILSVSTVRVTSPYWRRTTEASTTSRGLAQPKPVRRFKCLEEPGPQQDESTAKLPLYAPSAVTVDSALNPLKNVMAHFLEPPEALKEQRLTITAVVCLVSP